MLKETMLHKGMLGVELSYILEFWNWYLLLSTQISSSGMKIITKELISCIGKQLIKFNAIQVIIEIINYIDKNLVFKEYSYFIMTKKKSILNSYEPFNYL